MKTSKTKSGIAAFSVIIAISIFISIIKIISTEKIDNSGLKIKKVLNKNKSYIAAVYIEGIIEEENKTFSQNWVIDTISTLKLDKANKGIALYIDSPGGSVYTSDEVYLALQDYKTTGKPIYVYQGPLAASGGYYISCAGTKIYSNRNTLTGSIGVIMATSYDLTELFEKLGIKSETITAGTNKNMFSHNEPVTNEQRKIMQSIADDAYEQFVGIAAMSRNIPLFEMKKLADGRIYSAKQALDNGLIDAIGSWDSMLKDMSNNNFEGEVFKIVDYKYQSGMTFRDFILNNTLGLKQERKALNLIISKAVMQYPAYLYLP